MSKSSVREYAILYVGGKVVQSGIQGGNAIVTPATIEQAITNIISSRPGPPGERGEQGESGVIFLQAAAAAGGGGSALTVQEVDGSPIDSAITKIIFPNDSLSITGHEATVRQVPTAFIGARAFHSTTQGSLAAGSVNPLNLDSEDWDTDGFHSTVTNNTRFTVPPGMGGKYLLVGSVTSSLSGATAGEATQAYWRKNGAAIYGSASMAATGLSTAKATNVEDLVAGDYVELCEYHGTGTATVGHASARHVQTEAIIVKLDSGKVGAGIGALAYRVGNQTAITTEYKLAMDAEASDTDGFHDNSTNNTRHTIPAGLGGKYVLTGGAYVVGIGSTNYVDTRIKKNNTTYLAADRRARSPDDNTLTTVGCIVDLAAGDYVELTVQSDDASFDLGTGTNGQTNFFSIARLDSGSGRGVGSTRQAVTRTAGSFTLAAATTTMTEVDSAMRLTLPARVGDVIAIGVGALLQAGASGEAALDTAVIVGGSVVRTIGAGSRGVGHIYTSSLVGGGGSLTLVVASGDVSGGTVTLSLAYINSSLGSTGLLYATTTYGLHYWAVNLGQ